MTSPFITPEDEYSAKTKSPLGIGQFKLNSINFLMTMTDAEIDALAAQAKEIKSTYLAWEEFYNDLRERKIRLLGFEAVLTNLDVVQVAAELGTTVQALSVSMGSRAAAERARIAELQAMWNSGALPPGDILTETIIPVAGFTMDVVLGPAPLTVAFTDTTTNAATEWFWEFGDGTTSTLQNPVHGFLTPGTYTVTLTATNEAGPSVPVSQTVTATSLL